MFIEFERGLSDAKRWFRKSDLSLRNFGGKNVASAPPRPANPKTGSQTAARESMRAAAEAWRALPETGRAAWGAYAAEHGAVIADQMYKDLCGWDVFLPAWRNCSLLGTAPPQVPLGRKPPAAVVSAEELLTGSDETFSFRITHGAVPEGHLLLVRMTPATATRARRPYARQARLIAGHTSGSLLPLPPSGEVVTFTAPRFPIRPGERFGLALRVVRIADGIHSREFFADLERVGPETPGLSAGDDAPTEVVPVSVPSHSPTDPVACTGDFHQGYSRPGGCGTRPCPECPEPALRVAGTPGSPAMPSGSPVMPSGSLAMPSGSLAMPWSVPATLKSASSLSPPSVVFFR